MQKHFQTKLFSLILGITFLLIPEFANAGIISLPRYTGEFAYRSNSGGRDKTCSSSYKYTCSGTGYAGGVGTSCNDLYTSCSCSANYKWSGGSCVLKSCSDYGYSASKDNTKSCEEKTPRSGLTCYVCTACDSSTYKYACSGGLNAAEQDTANKCGTNYSECSCVEHASWNSSSGKCECGSDYKAGTTSCTLKTCEDYGYSATEDTTKDCTKQTPRSGLTCWNCSDCTGMLYDCSSMANASGGSGTACGGKYPQCTCKDLYRWDNGTCKLNCTRNSCSTTTYPLTAQNAANASSYEKCTPSCSDESPRYKVSACASGYSVNSSGSSCTKNQEPLAAPYLYADLSVSSELNSSKTVIGIVFDSENKLAVSLKDLGGNTQCNQYHSHEFTTINGQQNSKIKYDYFKHCGDNCCYNSDCSGLTFDVVTSYSTNGTQSGDWFLPDNLQLQTLFSNRDAINNSLAKVSGAELLKTGEYDAYMGSDGKNWASYIYMDSGILDTSDFDTVYAEVRPIINYGSDGYDFSCTGKWYYDGGWGSPRNGKYYACNCYISFSSYYIWNGSDCIDATEYEEIREPEVCDYLYADRTTSATLDNSKTLIGIVVQKKDSSYWNYVRAIALKNLGKGAWADGYSHDWPVSYKTSLSSSITDSDGYQNTSNIYSYAQRNSISADIFKTVQNYSTSGTSKGEWYIPSMGELNTIHANIGCINTALKNAGYSPISTEYPAWSSTMYNGSMAWTYDLGTRSAYNGYEWSTDQGHYYIIPMLRF